MSFWSKLRRAFSPSDDFWYHPVGFNTREGIRVSEDTALKYLTVFSCVSLISGDIARLPLNLYKKRTDGGKDLVIDHHLYDLLHNAPNDETTSFNFRESLQGHLLLWGNAFCYIERSVQDKIKALWQFSDPSQIKVERVRGEIVYTYKNSEGKELRATRKNIFHIPGFGYNGVMGLSMISLAQEAIALGVSTEQFGTKYFDQGTHPSGVLEMERVLGDNRDAFVKSVQAGYAGLGKSHKIMILENGMTYKPLTVPLNDAQFLDTRSFQKTEICGMYHVPPHKIAQHGQNSNYNNLEQENASYVDSCLMHWIVRWESAISQQLLTPVERRSGLFFEFQVQGLLRGDSAARADYYNKLFQVGAMSPNKILSLENENPVEGGDQHFVMLNMVPLDKAGQLPMMPNTGKEEPKKEEPALEKKDFARFFAENRESRSIDMRDRIAARYQPLILDAAQFVVGRESRKIKQFLGKRAAGSIETFLDEFYSEFPEYINQMMGPVLRSYMLAIIDAANLEFDLKEADLGSEVQDYIARYVERHIDSSRGQLLALLEESPEALEARADEWLEKRPARIAEDERVRAAGAAYSFAVFGAGMSLIWRTRGSSTCGFCRSLSGKKIRSGEHFLAPGDEIDLGDGTAPMRVYGLKRHPPAHSFCDCYVSGA